MSNPEIKYFAESGTWVKPERAVRVDIVLKGGDAGGNVSDEAFTRASLGRRVNPNGIRCSNGEPGDITVSSWDATDLDDTVEVRVGRGGRPGGRDGYALIITHLAEGGQDGVAVTGEFTVRGAQVTTFCGEPRPGGGDWLLCRFDPGHPGGHRWEAAR
jgi:hypothetical protein